jgi:hypothetical protein
MDAIAVIDDLDGQEHAAWTIAPAVAEDEPSMTRMGT